MYVLNIPEISFSKHTGEMTLEMYFRQSWIDPRLQWTAKHEEVGGKLGLINTDTECILLLFLNNLDIGDLIGGKEIADRIWLPDTFFVNERSSEFKETFLKISKDGTVLYSRRTRVTFIEV